MNKSSIAVIDEKGRFVSYQELSDMEQTFYQLINHRTFIFVLADNSLASLVAYRAAIHNHIVVMMLSNQISESDLTRLVSIYSPEYIWCIMVP